MRNKFLVILFSILLSGISLSQSSVVIAKRLHDLQNSIVEKSFKRLRPYAWADYLQKNVSGVQEHIHAVYLGRKTSYHMQGQRFYVIEISVSHLTGQIWYRTNSKNVAGYPFFTLEPMEIYANMDNRLVYIGKNMIDFFMSRNSGWSVILHEGIIMNPPDLNVNVQLRDITFSFTTGKRVKAVKIISGENGSFVVVSDEVPFGMVESRSADGTTVLKMLDFGFSGGSSRFDDNEIRSAKSIFNLTNPFGKGF